MNVSKVYRRYAQKKQFATLKSAILSGSLLGDLKPDLTYEINHEASVRLASLAREAGAERFVFSSSCTVYGDPERPAAHAADAHARLTHNIGVCVVTAGHRAAKTRLRRGLY